MKVTTTPADPQRFVLLPLTAHAAARVIRRWFDAAQVRELARLLHGGGEKADEP
jgi:hypothetical protein